MRAALRRIVGRWYSRQRYEVWEASDALRPFFLVAFGLTWQQAKVTADRHARRWPSWHVLVLDQDGATRYRAFQPGNKHP
jgi:hypothetical protein